MELDELYQHVILDHSKRPRNFGTLPAPALFCQGTNPSCGDEVTVYLNVGDSGTVSDVRFSGQGCSICMASSSMLTIKAKGKTVEETKALLHEYQNMITAKEEPTSLPAALGELKLFKGVRKFPQRVKCATLCSHAMLEAFQSQSSSTTTEQ